MFKSMVTLMGNQDICAGPVSIHSRKLHNSSGHLEIHNHMWLDGLRSMLNSVFAKILGRAIVGPARFMAPKKETIETLVEQLHAQAALAMQSHSG
jgi:hypothetical protein